MIRRSSVTLQAIFLLTAIGLIVYANSFGNQFLWDDEFLIVQNPLIRHWATIPKLFQTELRVFSQDPSNFYRPLQSLSYFLDYQIWGGSPFGYHLTNLLLHLANAVLLYFLASRLLEKRGVVLFVCLLFLIHPIQTEAITYISGRAEPLSTLFLLGALLFWMRGKTFFSLLCFGGGLLSKENSLVFPFLLLWTAFCFGKYSVKKTRWFFGVLSFYLLVRFFFLNFAPLDLSSSAHPFGERFLTFFRALLRYVGLLLFPRTLTMERKLQTAHSLFEADIAISLLGLFGLCFFFALRRRQSSDMLFTIGWFFLALLPSANLFPIGVQMAEHFLYFPSIGFFLFVGLIVEKNLYKGVILQQKMVLPLCALLVLVPLGTRTVIRNRDWKDDVTLYKKTLETSPHSFIVLNNLGAAYDRDGRIDEALPLFQKAIALNERYHKAWNNLGVAYARKGDFSKALPCYEKAIEMNSTIATYHYHLGYALEGLGKEKEAIRAYQDASKRNPSFIKPHLALGLLYKRSGQYEEAAIELENANRIDSRYPGIHTDLGEVYLKLGEEESARKEFEEALRLDPTYQRARKALQSGK